VVALESKGAARLTFSSNVAQSASVKSSPIPSIPSTKARKSSILVSLEKSKFNNLSNCFGVKEPNYPPNDCIICSFK